MSTIVGRTAWAEKLWKKIWSWQGALSVWASIATIALVIPAVVGVFRVPQVEITNIDELNVTNNAEFIKLAAVLRRFAEQKGFVPDAEVVRTVSRLDVVVRRDFGVIQSGSKPFVLREGQGVFLANTQGDRLPLGVSTIHTQHRYLYIGVNDERRQLYVGQSAGFDIGNSPCTLTLMAIDVGRKEGSFNFRC